ncbi:MAG: hypothetical protein ACRDNK_18670 [Solirubrobacteraceae bacterium]
MPYVIGRPPKRVLALIATTVGMLVTASPALADGHHGNHQGDQVQQVAATPVSPDASCPAVTSTQLLSGLGDSAFYAPVSGGTFEGSTDGWSFRNASVVSGNEPWNVFASTDSNSLGIAAGGSATSPPFCLDYTLPSFRFFANSADRGRHSGLNVAVRWTLSNGDSGQVPVRTLSAGSYDSWKLSPALPLGSALDAGQTVTVQFVFTAGTGSAWNIDDVLLDPYAK